MYKWCGQLWRRGTSVVVGSIPDHEKIKYVSNLYFHFFALVSAQHAMPPNAEVGNEYLT